MEIKNIRRRTPYISKSKITRQQTLLWTGVGIAILFLLYFLSPVLTPFMLGMALAYILAPGVQVLQRLHFPSPIAVAVMILLLLGFILGLVLIVLPLLSKEVYLAVQQLPYWVTQYNIKIAPQLDMRLGIDSRIDINNILSFVQTTVAGKDDIFSTLVGYIKASTSTVIFLAIALFLIPIVSIYLLLDWKPFINSFKDLIPRRFLHSTLEVLKEIDRLLSSYLRGQIVVMLILAVYYSVSLSIAGFESAIPIGVLTGLLVFIPYLGFSFGLILAIISSLLQFDSYYGLVSIAIIYGIGQILEGMVLTPKIMGNRIGLHPLVIIFSIFVFGRLFGFFGVLLALPMSAAFSVIVRRVYHHYLSSDFYREEI